MKAAEHLIEALEIGRGVIPIPLADRVLMIVDILECEYQTADLGNRADPIEELIYICLTRQTHWQNAARSWKALIEAGGPEAIARMPRDELQRLLQPSGFSHQKATWIQQALLAIRARFGQLSLDGVRGWTDDTVETFLRSLPGVSIKSAKCIMMYSLQRRVLPVDVHLRRITTRVGIVSNCRSERRIHNELESCVPADHRYSLHVNAIWHGRTVCTALAPRCEFCAIRNLCDMGSTIQGSSSTSHAEVLA